jgi:hypothetical protein
MSCYYFHTNVYVVLSRDADVQLKHEVPYDVDGMTLFIIHFNIILPYRSFKDHHHTSWTPTLCSFDQREAKQPIKTVPQHANEGVEEEGVRLLLIHDLGTRRG